MAFGKRPLFGNFVEPACRYCQHRGVVAPYDSCRKYRYDPLRRVPSRQPVLPQYDQSDFEL